MGTWVLLPWLFKYGCDSMCICNLCLPTAERWGGRDSRIPEAWGTASLAYAMANVRPSIKQGGRQRLTPNLVLCPSHACHGSHMPAHLEQKQNDKINHCPTSNHFLLLHLRFHWGTSEGGCALSSGSKRAALGFILPSGLGVDWADSASRVFNFSWATEGPETDSSPGKGRGAWRPTPSHRHLWSLWSYLNNGASWTCYTIQLS